MSEKIILGIDPGTLIMGYGLIKQNGNRLSFIKMGVFNFKKIEDPLEKLKQIYLNISEVIEEFKPDIMSIESPFFGKNPQSLIKLGRAQGVAISTGLSCGLQVFEYAPLKIKQSITGNGRASKEQVCSMLFRILSLNEETPKYLDATDALGAAVCHALKSNLPSSYSIVNRNKSVSKIGDYGVNIVDKDSAFMGGNTVNRNASNGAKNINISKTNGKTSKLNTWNDFLVNNPERLKK